METGAPPPEVSIWGYFPDCKKPVMSEKSTKDKAIELQNKIRVDDAYREFIEDITIENINQ